MRAWVLSIVMLSACLARAEGPIESRFIRITWDPSVFTLDEKEIAGLLARPGIFFPDERGVKSVMLLPVARSVPGPTLPSSMLFALRVETQGEPAAPVLEEIVRWLESLLQGELGAFVERLNSAVRGAEQERDGARDRLESLRHALAERQGRLPAEAIGRELEAARARLAELERQAHENEIGRVSREARAEAVAKRIAEFASAKRERPADADAVVRELRRIIDVRTEQLARIRLLADQGRASVAEIQEAEAKIAEAKVELVRREQELERPAQSDEPLKALKAEQQALLLDLEDQRVRRAAIEQQFSRTREELAQVEKQYAQVAREAMSTEEIQFDLALARKRYEEAAGEADALRRRMKRLASTQVTILDRRAGKPAESPK